MNPQPLTRCNRPAAALGFRSSLPRRGALAVLLILATCLASACASTSTTTAGSTRQAPLFSDLGDYHRPVTTGSAEAQRYFDQGLVLAWAFNHAEAARSFREAARLDPQCASCWWGLALVLGPNINAPMEADAYPQAWEAMSHARELAAAGHATEVEKALIEALESRYAATPPEDRSPLDHAFADAMAEVHTAFPADPDVATLYAEALMDTMPWDYWQIDGEAKPATRIVLRTLEGVLESTPDHPGALHLWIHTVEKEHPEWGVEVADRLRHLVPGAGHLVHMPSHIYIRVRRYAEAADANRRAVAADESYVTQCHAQGLYPLAYMPHNHHFLLAAASFQGDSATALDSARHISQHTDPEAMRQPGLGTLQHFWVMPLYTQLRFGRWGDVLATPEPPEDLLYPRGVWHYAQGLAELHNGRLEAAGEHLDALGTLAEDPALESVTLWGINGTADLLEIAVEVLSGELAAARGDHPTALAHLELARDLEDTLTYDEPPSWPVPVRHHLGAVQLEAGDPVAAETTYREDLARFPANGWSLYGLAQALEAQGSPSDAAEVREQLAEAWEAADVALVGSRF